MLLKSSSTSSNFSNASMAHTGIGSKALFNSFMSNSSIFSAPWIIDSGASDHMKNSFKLFQAYTPCFGNKKIKVADGVSLLLLEKVQYRSKKKSTLILSFMFQN